MTQNLLHQPHGQTKVNHRGLRQPHTPMHPDTNAVLRDIAFVLQMTQKVRAEIEAKSSIPEAATL